MAAPQPGAELVPYSSTTRPTSLSGQITHDGSTGYAAEAGRYQLYASLACPWSHRALIVRALLGLDQVIGLTLTDPIRDERGWRFPATHRGVRPPPRAPGPPPPFPPPPPRLLRRLPRSLPLGHPRPPSPD